ncbi:hypothetical protein [Dinghuibacter silviterrae]|uniref:hypothetical protein n=1 Tax=Dinghuibacter silviterrae TaxID=1539049 RepID=UPI0010638214|nr:hypothetical protein [Dinghuibacter silviterrae]
MAFLLSCQSRDRSAKLVLYNRSNRTIHFYVSCDSAYTDFKYQDDSKLQPHDSIRPYLLFGPEGKGPDKNTWVNAINLADDSCLHVFFAYIDFQDDPNLRDSLFYLIVVRHDYSVDSLNKMHWKIEYR